MHSCHDRLTAHQFQDEQSTQNRYPPVLIFPALLDRLSHSLVIFFAIVLEQIARFDIGRTRRVGIVQQTMFATRVSNQHRHTLSSSSVHPSIHPQHRNRNRNRRRGKWNRQSSPLHARQDRGDIVGGTPAILENVETQLAGVVDVGMEHLRDEFHAGRFVGILLVEMHDEPERAVFERRVGGSDDDGVPGGETGDVSGRPEVLSSVDEGAWGKWLRACRLVGCFCLLLWLTRSSRYRRQDLR